MLRPLAGLVAALVIALPAAAAPDPNDPRFGEQWGLARIQATGAWDASRGAGAVVAVIDSGVDFGHEDLAGKSGGSWDCRRDRRDQAGNCAAGGSDDYGHGTQVSGVIAAAASNGKGIAGVAPDARIMSVKVLGTSATCTSACGTIEDVEYGIRWAADQGARVINLSLGPDLPLVFNILGNPLVEAFEYAAGRGSLVVAAAGNDALLSAYSGNNVLVVGATGPDDRPAGYSSRGAEIYAPGGSDSSGCPGGSARCILTTNPGGYKAVQGTSFAAPHVAGAAALLAAKGNSKDQIASAIISSADQVGSIKRLNAASAVGSAPAPPPASPSPTPPPPSSGGGSAGGSGGGSSGGGAAPGGGGGSTPAPSGGGSGGGTATPGTGSGSTASPANPAPQQPGSAPQAVGSAPAQVQAQSPARRAPAVPASPFATPGGATPAPEEPAVQSPLEAGIQMELRRLPLAGDGSIPGPLGDGPPPSLVSTEAGGRSLPNKQVLFGVAAALVALAAGASGFVWVRRRHA